MAFVNEIPSAEDIEKYDLPYKLDLDRPIENRRIWTVDRERNSYLTGGGLTGNPAFEDNLKTCFRLYLAGSKFEVILEPRLTPNGFDGNPYQIYWPALLSIWALRPQENRMLEVSKSAWEQPDKPNPVLNNMPLNQFVALFKEAVSIYKAGDYNRHIHHPITVSFGF
jgi:hypothetical protein